jgi:thymidylate synthase (FAD)
MYEWAIKNGIAKEQARAVLPEGCTMSRLYMAGTIRSWVHYCDLRRGNGTQLEHREIAEACWKIMKQEFPSIVDALREEE